MSDLEPWARRTRTSGARVPALDQAPRQDLAVFLCDLAAVVDEHERVVRVLLRVVLVLLAERARRRPRSLDTPRARILGGDGVMRCGEEGFGGRTPFTSSPPALLAQVEEEASSLVSRRSPLLARHHAAAGASVSGRVVVALANISSLSYMMPCVLYSGKMMRSMRGGPPSLRPTRSQMRSQFAMISSFCAAAASCTGRRTCRPCRAARDVPVARHACSFGVLDLLVREMHSRDSDDAQASGLEQFTESGAALDFGRTRAKCAPAPCLDSRSATAGFATSLPAGARSAARDGSLAVHCDDERVPRSRRRFVGKPVFIANVASL